MTFSIGFEEANGEKGDEFVYSDLIAERFGTDHHQIFVPSAELIERAARHHRARCPSRWSPTTMSASTCCRREVAKHIKVVQSGQGADEVFAGYHWYPPLAGSNDVVGDYARVFFDRSHDDAGDASSAPAGCADSDVSRELRRASICCAAGADDAGRQGAAARFHGDAGRRSGEAGRQHDHGLGPGGARAVPRPRTGRTRRHAFRRSTSSPTAARAC